MNNTQPVTIKQLLKNRILWRVYFLWFLRRIVPLIAAQLIFFLIFLKIFARNVFVSQVFHNAANVADFGYWALFKYSLISFINARPITQIISLLILGLMALLLRDLLRALITYRSMWKARYTEVTKDESDKL